MALAGLQDGLAVYGFGGGSPALLMPSPEGAATADFAVLAVIERLARLGHEVVTFDPPQSGRSVRPACPGIDEMIDCAGEALSYCGINRPADLIGHGQGGLAALAFALERPERVRSLVLVCSAASGSAFLRPPAPLWLSLRNRLSRRDPRAAWASESRALDFRARLGEVRLPTLVISAARDPWLAAGSAEALAAGIQDSRAAVLKESGHYPFFDEPEAFWSLVSGFLHSCLPQCNLRAVSASIP